MKEVNGDYRPIVVLPCIIKQTKVTFLAPSNEITVTAEDNLSLKMLKDALEYCNGNVSIEEIVADIYKNKDSKKYKSMWEDGEDILDAVIRAHLLSWFDGLAKAGAVIDSREQYWHFHKVSSYPTTFLSDLSQDEIAEYHDKCKTIRTDRQGEEFALDWDYNPTPFISELAFRESCRNFNPNRTPALSTIRDICHAGYGYSENHAHRVVPSAGDLYPLKLYVVSLNRGSKGYYEYNPENNSLIGYRMHDAEQLKYCLNSEDMMGAGVFIVISADLDRQGYKYANRAYRFCLIEAGHVAQNINIHAVQHGLSTCELGGVLDDAIHDELLMGENEVPLLTIALGYQAELAKEEEVDIVRFVEENVGEDKPVKAAYVWTDGGGLYTATAEYEDHGEVCVGGGTARSDKYAIFKAVVEAYERYVSFGDDSHARPDNSSGIAAHFDFEKAQHAALAELIERDAIMRCWMNKESPEYVNRSTWTEHARRRAQYWSSQGRKLSVLNLSSKYAPVVLVTITSDEYPYFVCGAASGMREDSVNQIVGFQSLIDRALREAESSALYYVNNPEPGRAPRPEDVYSPEDHGKFYRKNKTAAENVSWLTSGKHNVMFAGWEYSFEQLIEMLHVETEVLGELENGLVVVKLTSPDLKPMTFGFDKTSGFPHFFA